MKLLAGTFDLVFKGGTVVSQDGEGPADLGVRDGRIVTVTREELGIAPNVRIPRREATYAYKRDRCLRCGDEIRRLEIANRTCYYCPTDQPGA